MADIYRGTGWGASCIGSVRYGRIYEGTGWGASVVGEYSGSDEGGAAAALLLLMG